MEKDDVVLVYCEVEDPLGRAIHRVAEATKKYAPDRVALVNDPQEADLQVIPTIGMGQVNQINRRPNLPYVLWQLCYLTTEEPNPEFWQPIWEKSVLTASYYNLPVTRQENFLLTPIGFEPDKFFNDPARDKYFDAVITGYVDAPVGEELANVVTAFNKVVHVGGDIGLDGVDGYFRMEGISDKHMRYLYQTSRYSIGLRHSEGFELPILEGQACGAVGVAFNLDCYTRWFSDFAIFLDIDEPVLPQLKALARQDTIEWQELDLSRFYWENVISNFWNKVLEQWDQ